MEIFVLTLLLVILSYILGGRAFRAKRLHLGSLLLLAYGAEFIVIGIILGPYGLGFLTLDVIDRIEPLLNIALGWIGLMFGFQLRFRDLKLLPLSNYSIAGIEALITYALTLGVFLVAGYVLFQNSSLEYGISSFAFVLAAIAAASSPAVVAAVVRRMKAHGRVSRLMRYAAGFDNVISVALFGLAYPFFHLTYQRGDMVMPGWGWLAISIASGLLLGILFHFFTTPKASSNENTMIAVGMVVLSSGIAAYLHLSALFINLIVGAVLCNFSERQDRFYRLLISAEKPLYGILLIIAGALWYVSWIMFAFAAIFILFRVAAKTTGCWVALKPYRGIMSYPARLGPALLAQGGMALAIALDYRFLAPGEASNMMVSLTLTCLAINGILGTFAARHLLALERECA